MLKRRQFIKLGGLTTSSFIIGLNSCNKKMLTEKPSVSSKLIDPELDVQKTFMSKGAYLAGEAVKVSFELVNTGTSPVSLTELHVFLKDISDPYATFQSTINIATNITIAAGQKYVVTDKQVWVVPGYALLNAFGVFVGGTRQGGATIANTYQTFFRVTHTSRLSSFAITSSLYQGLKIHSLDGGMSAEYAVVKSLENLSPGVANSWLTSAPGSGPNSVYSSQDFLERSINQTVNYYNTQLGATTVFDTVIISTGVACIPYLSRTMKAPVLPAQFLVSCDSVKEIISVLQYAKDKGIDSYSTLGYDGSVTMAVAWVKLLQLPPQYIQFLKDHQVTNVVFTGTISNGAGEGTARKIKYNSTPDTGYNQGDIFLLYTEGGTANDVSNLQSRIRDLQPTYNSQLEPSFRQISDWESGLVDEQVNNFAVNARAGTSVSSVKLITATAAGGTLELYNLATYLTLAFMKKNGAAFPALSGVAMNPYLLSHPLYETKINYIPMLFWQLSPANDVVTRLDTVIKNAVLQYYPATNVKQLNIWVNTSKNFGGFRSSSIVSALDSTGYDNHSASNPNVEELWNPADGMTSICETVVNNILLYSSPSALKNWNDGLAALAPSDLDAIPSKFSNILVINK